MGKISTFKVCAYGQFFINIAKLFWKDPNILFPLYFNAII